MTVKDKERTKKKKSNYIDCDSEVLDNPHWIISCKMIISFFNTYYVYIDDITIVHVRCIDKIKYKM